MTDQDAIIRSQADLYTRITRIYENLKKMGAANITFGVVESRLNSLEAYWTRFEENHSKLLALPSAKIADYDYIKHDISSLTEDSYLHQKGQLLDLIRSLKSAEERSLSTNSPVSPESSLSVPMPTPVTRTTLPRIQLPHFSGKYEDWPAFRDLFLSIIGNDKNTSQVEKLHYLKSCLKGEAEILIRNLTTTQENYEHAWNILSGYYENKRLLVRSYLSNFTSLQKMKSESASEFRKVFHCLKSTVSSLASIGRPLAGGEDLFVFLATELLDQRSRREWETSISDTTEPPSYDELEKFFERRLHMLESLMSAKNDSASNGIKSGSSASARSLHTRKQDAKSEKRGRCFLCHQDHYLMLCEDYRSKSAPDRKQLIEANNLCFNCLGRHKVSECASKKVCSVCSARHHTSLHDACRVAESASKSSLVISEDLERPVAVMLATARVRVADRFDSWHNVRALIDQGSETSIISEGLAQRLRLSRTASSINVFGIGGLKVAVAKCRTMLTISPRFPGPSLVVSAIILPQLTVYTGGFQANKNKWSHLQGLELADPDYYKSDAVELLLGAEVYSDILVEGLRKGGYHQPVAQNTSIGWLLTGAIESTSSHSLSISHISHQSRVDEDLSSLVRSFWEQEELLSTTSIYSREEQECEEHYVRTHSRQPDGRYVVRLPLRLSPSSSCISDLSGTRRAAERALKRMEGRFVKDERFRTRYVDFLQQYRDLGHMSRVSNANDSKRVCYLPHHGVLRESSVSTKLRVVFNGSYTLMSGESLNSNLHAGPSLLPALPDILLRWRRHRYVIATDVEKMFRQIVVHPEDRDFQRILWREAPDQDIQEFQLNTVTYGLACAPFLAIRTLRQLAEDEKKDFPLGAEALLREVYMDDILSGASTIESTKEIVRQITQICTAGGFPLKKWSANDALILEEVPIGDRLQQESRWWRPDESHTMLGLRWHPHNDSFSFAAQFPSVESFTKRSALSLSARIFDPLGFLSPVTVRAKIFLQATWLLGLDWDTPLPDENARCWRDFFAETHFLKEIRVSRWMAGGVIGSDHQIHGFADASEKAYAAVLYLRTKNREGLVEVRIITAKTRVAPLKQITLPRLELCAALLLVKLTAHIYNALNLENVPLHLWSDSTVVLGWIRGHPSSWKTFVANRVSTIQTTLPNAIWHHIPGKENPADCASRGVSPKELVNHLLWWHGPLWLQDDCEIWSLASDVLISEDPPERRNHSVLVSLPALKNESLQLLQRFSSLRRLLRVTAWCRRWLLHSSSRRKYLAELYDYSSPTVLQAAELAEARICWISLIQAEEYENIVNNLRKGINLPANNILKKLNPYLDNSGILRVGGRLKHSLLSDDEKHPIILPAESHFTRLVIEAAHRRVLHGGVQLTLSVIRQEFWILRGRAQTKKWIHRCLTCSRWRAVSQQPLMGDLPAPRVTPARPFLHTGVDYAGPIRLRTSKGRGHRSSKAFIVVFVCLSTKAVHLDVASDYTADAFLAALRRFISRRGVCHTLYSDCGTNFIGADAQLRALFTASNSEGQRISSQLAEDRIRWRFNPPAAPNFGGIWEAAVKSFKHHLRRVIGDSTLTFEEMSTLLSQIEACLNSRPLQAITDDPEDLSVLTPGHFLIGTALTAIPEPLLIHESPNRLTRWKLLQSMRDHFWVRWSKEYLHSLMHRPKWNKTCEQIDVGRLCLLKNELLPPSKWPLARVERLHPGKDGHVRVVDIRTATSSLTRPVSKLVLLPVCSNKDA